MDVSGRLTRLGHDDEHLLTHIQGGFPAFQSPYHPRFENTLVQLCKQKITEALPQTRNALLILYMFT